MSKENSKIKDLTKQLLVELGENPDREGLLQTPHRVAKAWGFLSQGYRHPVAEHHNSKVEKQNFNEAYKHILHPYQHLYFHLQANQII